MATENKEKKVVETEEENKTEEKENKEMSEDTKKEEKGTVKEKKEKEGFFKKIWKGAKKHKREIFACAGGILAGVGGTLGVEKLGEMYGNKKNAAQQQNYIESENVYDETLSPNE